MTTVLQMLTSQLGGDTMAQLSRTLGADRGATQNAVTAALPLLLGALANNASRGDGAAALHGAIQRDHDGSVLDNVAGFLNKPDEATGNGILGHVLGGRRQTVEAGVSRASGMDQASVSKLLTFLAPLVMGGLGRAQRERRLDASALSGMLTDERRQLESAAPGLGGLAGLIDSDGDGQIVDDVARLGRGVLGKLFGR